jgi:hypothetical protein
VADLQERIGQTEHRLAEIILELKCLGRQAVDEGDLRAALDAGKSGEHNAKGQLHQRPIICTFCG